MRRTLEPFVDNQDPLENRISDFEEIPINPTYKFSTDLQNTLYGKQLLLEELSFPIQEIQDHYKNGYILFRKGIEFVKNTSFCVRCGNTDKSFFASFPCARCGQDCTYCRKCITMGRVSECTPLISWNGPVPVHTVPAEPLVWKGTLSDGQKMASDEMVKTVQGNDQLLIWAVCGAGKTEILFEGISESIKHGKRVCIATPRTDVVIELTPRIQASFPHIDVIALYGGSEDRTKNAPLTIATTHQLLRFYRAFDVVIIDEVDAFPYSVEPMLQYAVEQAKKENVSTIFLTATPNRKWQQEISNGKRKAVKIPARYHQHPLPVPSFVWCGNWEKKLTKKRLPGIVFDWLKSHLESGRQAFLFVPRIDYLEKIVKILQEVDDRIEGVHAEDPSRKERVAAFRKGDIPILVTTTILERGVTVPNIDVAVLGAEDSIFTESALVQISGRVGRSSEFPRGEITFFHFGRTREMVKAKRHIEEMNRFAAEKGLLKVRH